MGNNKYKVLIVEDDQSILGFVQTILETNGYQVLTAERCRQGLLIFSSYTPDLVVLAGFMTILSERVAKAYAYRMINVHPALIPSFCGQGYYGLRVHEAALEYGVKVTGATVHFVNEVADGGAIILQKAVEVQNGDTPEILQKRVMEQAEWEILPKAVSLFCDGRIKIQAGKAVVIE